MYSDSNANIAGRIDKYEYYYLQNPKNVTLRLLIDAD